MTRYRQIQRFMREGLRGSVSTFTLFMAQEIQRVADKHGGIIPEDPETNKWMVSLGRRNRIRQALKFWYFPFTKPTKPGG